MRRAFVTVSTSIVMTTAATCCITDDTGYSLRAMEKLSPKHDVAVYFTDGDGPAPATKPATSRSSGASSRAAITECQPPGAKHSS